jgi:hypothetical protein
VSLLAVLIADSAGLAACAKGGLPPVDSYTQEANSSDEDDESTSGNTSHSETSLGPSTSADDAHSTGESTAASSDDTGAADDTGADGCSFAMHSNACTQIPAGECPATPLWTTDTPAFSLQIRDCDFFYGTDVGLFRATIGSGAPQVLAPGLVRGIAVDDTHVYFTELISGEIRRVPREGGEPEVLIENLEYPWQIAIDQDSVYYITRSQVGSLSKSGGFSSVLAKRSPDELNFNTYHLAVGRDHVYYSTYGAELRAAPKAGGPSQVLATFARLGGLAVHDCNVFAIEGQDNDVARLVSIAVEGGPAQVLATGKFSEFGAGITVDDDHVYWNEGVDGSGRVLQVSKSGKEPMLNLADGMELPFGVVNTTQDVIWLENLANGTANVHRAPIGGC